MPQQLLRYHETGLQAITQAVAECEAEPGVDLAVRADAYFVRAKLLPEDADASLALSADAWRKKIESGEPYRWIPQLQAVVAERGAIRINRGDLAGAAA